MGNAATLEKVLELTKCLPAIDKVRLIERIAPQIARELEPLEPVPRKSLRGLWRGLDISDRDIDEARCEMWAENKKGEFHWK
jgi:hypothetical protein